MNYVIFKKDFNQEIRLYPDGVNFEGEIVFKGHKLSLESKVLAKLIDYRVEKSTGKLHFLKYDKVKENISHTDKSLWSVSSSENFNKQIHESWESLQRVLESRCGKFRKIVITVINI